jgi:hypothetical protein
LLWCQCGHRSAATFARPRSYLQAAAPNDGKHCEFQIGPAEDQQLPHATPGADVLRQLHSGTIGVEMAAAGSAYHRDIGGHGFIPTRIQPLLHV